jgi:predicted transport protein
MTASMLANLEEKTGHALDHWLKVAAKSGFDKHGKIVAHLKQDHGLTHGYANLIAHSHLQSAASDSTDTDLVAAQYAGAKAGLRPLYDALVAKLSKLGKDVELAPKKAYVSLRRSKQFGLIQPSTKTRIDLGLNLGGVAPKGRLEASGSFNSMVTHRVRLESIDDIDKELIAWIEQAYRGA